MSGKFYNVTDEQVRLEVQKQMRQTTNYADLTSQVAQSLRLDDSRKQRILARSPHLAYSMDAGEVAQASSRELAVRELKELGIDAGDCDPVQLLDAHHAGRQYARDYQIPGNRLTGGNSTPMSGNKLVGDGSARDASERISAQFLDKYLEE